MTKFHFQRPQEARNCPLTESPCAIVVKIISGILWHFFFFFKSSVVCLSQTWPWGDVFTWFLLIGGPLAHGPHSFLSSEAPSSPNIRHQVSRLTVLTEFLLVSRWICSWLLGVCPPFLPADFCLPLNFGFDRCPTTSTLREFQEKSQTSWSYIFLFLFL